MIIREISDDVMVVMRDGDAMSPTTPSDDVSSDAAKRA